MSRCRHNKTWLIAGGMIEWCYVCGAFRDMAPVPLTHNSVYPRSRWTKPSGDKNINPYKR